MHLRTAATSSAIGAGLVRKAAPLNDGGKSSVARPDSTTNGFPDAWSFRAIGSDVSTPRLTLRTATSHPRLSNKPERFYHGCCRPQDFETSIGELLTDVERNDGLVLDDKYANAHDLTSATILRRPLCRIDSMHPKGVSCEEDVKSLPIATPFRVQ
jgi:hypothetical protein